MGISILASQIGAVYARTGLVDNRISLQTSGKVTCSRGAKAFAKFKTQSTFARAITPGGFSCDQWRWHQIAHRGPNLRCQRNGPLGVTQLWFTPVIGVTNIHGIRIQFDKFLQTQR